MCGSQGMLWKCGPRETPSMMLVSLGKLIIPHHTPTGVNRGYVTPPRSVWLISTGLGFIVCERALLSSLGWLLLP